MSECPSSSVSETLSPKPETIAAFLNENGVQYRYGEALREAISHLKNWHFIARETETHKESVLSSLERIHNTLTRIAEGG